MPSLLSPTDSPALFSPCQSLDSIFCGYFFFLLFGLFFLLTDFNNFLMCILTQCVCGCSFRAPGGQKRVLEPLESELRRSWAATWVLEFYSSSLQKQQAFGATEKSVQCFSAYFLTLHASLTYFCEGFKWDQSMNNSFSCKSNLSGEGRSTYR